MNVRLDPIRPIYNQVEVRELGGYWTRIDDLSKIYMGHLLRTSNWSIIKTSEETKGRS